MDASPTQDSDERMNRALRLTASQASHLCGQGAALVYTHLEGDSTTGRLRAAAGFRSADEARQTAAKLGDLVRMTIDTAEPQSAPVTGPLAERLVGAKFHALPLIARKRSVGVLILAPATELATDTSQAIEILAPPPADRHAAGLGQVQQLFDALPGAVFIHIEFEGLATTAQPLTYRVNPVEIIDFHVSKTFRLRIS